MLSMHFCQIQLSKISFVKMQKKMNLQFDLEEVVGASAVSAEVLKGACLEADLQLICHFLFLELLLSNMSNAMGRVVAVVFLV